MGKHMRSCLLDNEQMDDSVRLHILICSTIIMAGTVVVLQQLVDE